MCSPRLPRGQHRPPRATTRAASARDPYGASPNPIPVWNGFGSKDDRVHGDVSELPLEADLIEPRLGKIFEDASLLYSVAEAHTRELAIDDVVRQPAIPSYAPVWSPVLVYDAMPGNAAGNEYLLFVILDDLAHHYPNAWRGAAHRRQTEKSLGVTMAALHY